MEARGLRAYRHFLGMTLRSQRWGARAKRWALGDPSWREHVEVDVSEEVREVAARKQGVIVVTAHVGDWESGSALLPLLGFGPPTYPVGRAARNKPLSLYIHRERQRRGVLILPRRGAMEFAGPILGAGGTLALILDQRARKRPVYAPFFGRAARCDRSAGVLLRRFRVPIVFAACYETSDPDRLRFVARRKLEPEDLQGRSPEGIASLVNRELEELIREAPDQYFWLHDRYQGGDDAEASNGRQAVTDCPTPAEARAPVGPSDRAAGTGTDPAEPA